MGLKRWIAERRSLRTVRDDVSEDPWLQYVLLLSVVTCGFWIWYRVPNFASPDEYSRLLDPMKSAGYAAADPGLEGLRRGLTDGRALGATFYLFGLVLVPLFVVVVVTGQFGEFTSLAGVESRWTLWHEVPAWFWTGSILLSRLIVVGFAVGAVYLTYRLGTVLRDRRTGRYAAALLAVTFGFVTMAHEAGEDVPMLFAFLLASYLAIRYAQTGERHLFLAGCAVGGLVIALKLTGGVIVFVLAAAYLLRVRREDGDSLEGYVRPRLLGTGAVLGALAILVGFPSVVAGGPEHLVDRVLMASGTKVNKDGGRSVSIWYWITDGYLRALGWPLAVAVVGGTIAAARTLRDELVDAPTTAVLLVSPVIYLAVYSQWSFVRMRHLLPTIPVFLLLLAIGIATLEDRRPAPARWIFAVLLLTSGTFVGVGLVQYTDDPRDQASDWMASNVGDDETVEVYSASIAYVGAEHGHRFQHYPYDERNVTQNTSLILNETAYTEWMTSGPDRAPEYIQLTGAEIRYVDPDNPFARRYPERAEYVRGLLDGELGYEVVAEYGEPREHEEGLRHLLESGYSPEPEQRADHVVILQRSDADPP